MLAFGKSLDNVGTKGGHIVWLLLLEERAYEAYRHIAAAQVVRPHGDPRHYQGVVGLSGDLGAGLLYRKGFAWVEVVIVGPGFFTLDADYIDLGTSILDGLFRLGKRDLLGARRSGEDGDLVPPKLVSDNCNRSMVFAKRLHPHCVLRVLVAVEHAAIFLLRMHRGMLVPLSDTF